MQEQSVQYWFNSQTGQVEVGPQSLALHRLGPFKTAEEAERAPQIIADRAAAWRKEEEERD
ncbi:MAG: hypothetical protein RL343_1031 [Actinomycetota bacterium]|jgi:hypothetical protein